MPGPLLKVQMSLRVAGARDSAPCQKWAKREGFCSISKNDGRRVTFEEDLERCMSRGRRSTRDIIIQGFWDDFAWQVQHFVLPGITFSWQAHYFRQVEWKNRKTHWYEAVSSALNFPFLKEVSQNSFVFDVVNFEKEKVSQNSFVFDVATFKTWGSLAELLCFWRCHVLTLRKSRRIVSFLMLSSSKIEEVSQHIFVSKLADRQIDR